MNLADVTERVSIVLVDTSHPGNIGAVARAMKNMGLRSLRLVRPRRFPHAEATARASGADDLLAAARIHASLDEAIADAALVYGATGRQRSLPWPRVTARDGAGEIVAGAARACIVFGNEQSGLGNEEMDRCQRLLCIPANPEYDSLNLAMSVQVVAYELRMAALGAGPVRVGPGEPPSAQGTPVGARRASAPASAAQVEALHAHYERTLLATGFLNPDNPRHLMRRLRRLYARAQLDENEVQILRGILSSVDRALPGPQAAATTAWHSGDAPQEAAGTAPAGGSAGDAPGGDGS